MNQDNILAIVAFGGGIAVDLLNANRTYLTPKINDALVGKPTTFSTGARQIGKCYYQYQEVVVNYTGADAEKPNGMCGKVQPSVRVRWTASSGRTSPTISTAATEQL
jgi:hypothetical protein